ncbi:MAG: hypothetical protein K5780_01460 [Alphaproteobacteria bacterium]|nr:hypothetical protein [Alphaproteobacteria bacterium]
MKKVLLIALITAQSDIQAMSLKSKISKMLPRHDCTLTTVVRETKDEEREFTNAKRGSRKNSLPIPIKTIKKKEVPSNLSDVGDLDYILNFRKGEVFSSNGFTQSLQNFNRTDKDECIFDMEPDTQQFTSVSTISNYAEQTPGYTLSEEYFPSFYRHDIQESQHGIFYNTRRRKSSIDRYYDKYETNKKNHSPGVLTNSDKETMTTYGLTLCEEILPKENRENLIRIFRDKCCDWSFKIVKQEKEIYIGELDSKRRLVFCSDVEKVVRNGEKMYILGKSSTKCTVSSWCDPMFFGDSPLSFDGHYINRLNEVFLELAQNPIGAELLHTVITKRISCHMPKLAFIPVQNTNISLEAGNLVQRQLARSNHEIDKYLIRDKFILYNPECPSDSNVRVVKYDSQSDKCVLAVRDVPFRVSLFNTLVHSLHENGDQMEEGVSFIKSRPNNAVMATDFKEEIPETVITISSFWLKEVLYVNDGGYKVMFGLPSDEKNLLCEAAYTASEGYIRMSARKYYDVITKVEESFKEFTDQKQEHTDSNYKLTHKQWDDILSQYIELDEDGFLFKEFLTQNNNCSKSGKGMYKRFVIHK